MRIQWNSDAAQEVLERLKRAERGLEEGMRQARLVEAALDEANAEGDDKALTRLAERFDACSDKLNTLAQQLEDFRGAVRLSDEAFEDAEQGVDHMIGNLESPAEFRREAPYQDSANWAPEAYAVMPDMRVRVAPIPRWLDQLTMAPGVL